MLGMFVVLGSIFVFTIAKRPDLLYSRVDAEREQSQARTAQEEWSAFYNPPQSHRVVEGKNLYTLMRE